MSYVFADCSSVRATHPKKTKGSHSNLRTITAGWREVSNISSSRFNFQLAQKGSRISRLSQSLPHPSRLATVQGVAPTSSHTNTQPNSHTQRGTSALGRMLASLKALPATVTNSIQDGGVWRYASHVLLLVLVTIIALAGKIQADSIHAPANARLGSQDSDKQTMLASGAILADQMQLVIAPDIKAAADDAASKLQLAITGDGFLAKTSPIAASAATKRGITNYTIKAGDTISSIAGQFNVTSDTLLWANNLGEDATLKPGQELIILPVNGILYTAKDGDSLDALATTYQASANLIDAYNQLEGKPLAAGQKIIIPDGVKPAPQPSVVSRVASAKPATRTLASFSGGANGYSYGYCTWYVANRRAVPANWGNASSWLYSAQASGYAVSTTPRPGAVAWEYGNHVAYVESVGNGTVTISEMNFWGNGGGWGRVSYRTTDASHFKYIY